MDTFRKQLEKLEQDDMLRRLQPLKGRGAGYVTRDNTQFINLSSNDYLGLAGDHQFLESFYSSKTDENLIDVFGLGSASSRLLTGDVEQAHQLEGLLAELYGREASLLFNSGYHANIGIISALFGKKDLVLSDKLNHASIHDGLRIGLADYKRFRHRDYEHLHMLLEKHRDDYSQVLIVSESVFSMDGDCADLAELVRLKKAYNCLIYLDEAHGVGLYGDQGLGLAEQEDCIDDIDFLVGTFGKACASIGAFIVCSEVIRDFLINRSRSLIFTTALPPVVLSWNYFVMRHLLEMKQRRSHLQQISKRLRTDLQDQGLRTGGSTNIVPVIIGEADRTVAGANYLQEQGFLILPVRPPTVPQGTSRFRLSLTADLTYDQLAQLPQLIKDWFEQSL